MMSALTLTITIGMTSNLPGLSPFAEASMSAFILAQQQLPDISQVPADFQKNFMQMLNWVLALVGIIGGGGLGYWLRSRGTKADPVHVHQPVHVKATVRQDEEHAGQSELDELRALFDAHVRENNAEHAKHRNAHSAMMQELLEKGNAREINIIKAINETKESINQAKDSITAATLKELKDIHNRINPMQQQLGEHTRWIQGVEAQLQTLWGIVKDALKDAHKALQEALSKKK